jgi:hypothetical protein
VFGHLQLNNYNMSHTLETSRNLERLNRYNRLLIRTVPLTVAVERKRE